MSKEIWYVRCSKDHEGYYSYDFYGTREDAKRGYGTPVRYSMYGREWNQFGGRDLTEGDVVAIIPLKAQYIEES